MYYQRIDNEKIISKIAEISKGCDQHGDRVLPYILSMRLKGLVLKYEKYGTLFIYGWPQAFSFYFVKN